MLSRHTRSNLSRLTPWGYPLQCCRSRKQEHCVCEYEVSPFMAPTLNSMAWKASILLLLSTAACIGRIVHKKNTFINWPSRLVSSAAN